MLFPMHSAHVPHAMRTPGSMPAAAPIRFISGQCSSVHDAKGGCHIGTSQMIRTPYPQGLQARGWGLDFTQDARQYGAMPAVGMQVASRMQCVVTILAHNRVRLPLVHTPYAWRLRTRCWRSRRSLDSGIPHSRDCLVMPRCST